MKIALPSRENQIDSHFGHCESFRVFTIENNQITKEEDIPSVLGCGCKSDIASSLADMGVTIMLAGNMGDGAVNKLQQAGISVIRGCDGNLNDVVISYLNGELTDSGEICHSHEEGHSCE